MELSNIVNREANKSKVKNTDSKDYMLYFDWT